MLNRIEEFRISLDKTKQPKMIFGEKCLQGVIVIGTFKERFNAPVEVWNADDYEKQWKEGLKRCLKRIQPSCLVTAMRDPLNGTFINIWPIYMGNDLAVFQNQILLCKKIATRFTGQNFYDFIEPHKSKSEDGTPISEWSVHKASIEKYLAERCPVAKD